MKYNRALALAIDKKANRAAAAVKSDRDTINPAAEESAKVVKKAPIPAAPLAATAKASMSLGNRTNWRTGIWSTMMDSDSLAEQAETHLISHVDGTVDDTFDSDFDEDYEYLDRPESATMLANIAKEKGISLCGITPEQTEADFRPSENNYRSMKPVDAILLTADLAVGGSMTRLDVRFNSNMGEEGKAALREAIEGRSGFKLLL